MSASYRLVMGREKENFVIENMVIILILTHWGGENTAFALLFLLGFFSPLQYIHFLLF